MGPLWVGLVPLAGRGGLASPFFSLLGKETRNLQPGRRLSPALNRASRRILDVQALELRKISVCL